MEILLGIAFKMLGKLATDVFISKIAVYSIQEYAKTTDNKWDDKVADAIAEAYGVDVKILK